MALPLFAGAGDHKVRGWREEKGIAQPIKIHPGAIGCKFGKRVLSKGVLIVQMVEICGIGRQLWKGYGIRCGREVAVHKERNRVGVVSADTAAPVCTIAIYVVEINFLVAANPITSGYYHDIA